jgi:hypothetical protein
MKKRVSEWKCSPPVFFVLFYRQRHGTANFLFEVFFLPPYLFIVIMSFFQAGAHLTISVPLLCFTLVDDDDNKAHTHQLAAPVVVVVVVMMMMMMMETHLNESDVQSSSRVKLL